VDARAAALPGRAYTAVAADADGGLVVAARAVDAASIVDRRGDPALRERVVATLRERPSSALVRQLARCARDYGCRAAANAFLRNADCAVPVAAPSNERPADGVAPHAMPDATPRESAALHATPSDIAEFGVDHLAGDGTMLAFGRACEGEPLLAARVIESAVAGVRARTSRGVVHVETNGSIPAAIRRLIDAGVDSLAFRIASARADTYEALCGPQDFRFTDVRAAFADAIAANVAVALVVLVMPGVTDRAAEVDALVALAGELPEGSQLLLRDLAADPERVRGILPPAAETVGIDAVLTRLRADAPHTLLATLARPLVRA
jgi:hypothetical protein